LNKYFTDNKSEKSALLDRLQVALNDETLPTSFLNFYISQIFIMNCINFISILSVGYLIVLHIYLRSQGLTTYDYVKKSQDEVAAKEKKARAEES
jgi:hypothetical protein